MSKTAVIGDYDSIYGFAATGLTVFPVKSAEEGEMTLKQIAGSGYDIIFVTEGLAAQIKDVIARYYESMTPAIIPIPGVKGNTGIGVENIKENVKKAVGSDVLFGDDE